MLISATFVLLPVLLQTRAQSVTVSVPLSAPSSAAPLDRGLVSFSIEQDRWTDWAGTDSPNTFFLNALANLAERTGEPPWIRIGANSEDHTDFSETVKFSEGIFPNPTATVPYPEAVNITVGADYYRLVSHLPAGTHVIWGVNLGSNNVTAAFLEARAIKSAFQSSEVIGKGITLEAVEIGNEADLYGNNGHRDPNTWNIHEYVDQWTEFAENVTVAAGISTSGPKFFGLAFSHNAHGGEAFSFENAAADGLLNSAPGKLINEISQHMYFGSGVAGIANLPSLMSKSAIRGNLSALGDDVASVHAEGLGFVLGETNSYFSHGAPGVSNAAGAAIWALDYALFAASSGVKRLHFHEGVGFRYNLIQPVTLTRSIIDASPLSSPLPPHIQPAYYGGLIAAEAVGTSGHSNIVELDIDDDSLSGYAVYEGRIVKRVVLINSEAFLSGDSERAERNVTLSFSFGEDTQEEAEGFGRGNVKRLAIGHADDTTGITWAGQSFDTGDAKPSGAVHSESLKLDNKGKLTVATRATEVLLLSF